MFLETGFKEGKIAIVTVASVKGEISQIENLNHYFYKRLHKIATCHQLSDIHCPSFSPLYVKKSNKNN